MLAVSDPVRADLVILEDRLRSVERGGRVRTEATLILTLMLGMLYLLHEILVDGDSTIRLPKHGLIFSEARVKWAQQFRIRSVEVCVLFRELKSVDIIEAFLDKFCFIIGFE